MKFRSNLSFVTFSVFVVISFGEANNFAKKFINYQNKNPTAKHLDPPKWSSSYHIKGTLHIPDSDIEMPFEAWYDESWIRSRIDYFNGLDKTYQLPEGTFGKLFKMVLGSDSLNNIFNSTRCFKAMKESFIQRVIPDMTYFRFDGLILFRGIVCQLFTQELFDGSVREFRKFLVNFDGREYYPVRYEVRKSNEMQTWNFLYEHFYIDYDYYDPKSVPLEIFVIKEEIFRSCRTGGNVFSLDPMAAYIDPLNIDSNDLKFHHFVNNYKKIYENRSEAEYRKKIFHENLQFIEAKNRENLGFKLAINHLADRTLEECTGLLGERFAKPFEPLPKIFGDNSENLRQEQLPEEYDWRVWGAVTPVKNQNDCGSCYAFSIAALMESAYYLRTRKLERFSEQAIIDCSWTFDDTGNNGCQGGHRFQALQWIKVAGGIPLDHDYEPYRGLESFCDLRNVSMVAPLIDYYRVTPNSTTALRTAIFNLGPISTSIDAHVKTIIFYSSGIYADPNCSRTSTNHAVLVVGYGTYKDGYYWIVKNSWGRYWGTDGYIMISANNNICGVLTAPAFVTLKDPY